MEHCEDIDQSDRYLSTGMMFLRAAEMAKRGNGRIERFNECGAYLDDIVRAARFLVSGDARGVTGVQLGRLNEFGKVYRNGGILSGIGDAEAIAILQRHHVALKDAAAGAALPEETVEFCSDLGAAYTAIGINQEYDDDDD